MTLRITDVSLAVKNEVYLDHVTLELHPGRIYTVIGRTLAGKSSLLRVLAGLDRPDSGLISLDDEDLATIPVWKRDTAMVYQQFINYPHMTVAQNVAFPLRRARLEPQELESRVEEAIAKVGLSGFESRRPSQLSGGQQQRVALARALARRSRLLLLDEPLVNLDLKLREQLRDEFRDLFSGVGDTIVVYTTTEPPEAFSLGDEVIAMHDGRVVQVGTPGQVFERPQTMDVATVVNHPPMNVVPGVVSGDHILLSDTVKLAIPPHLRGLQEGEYKFGIRANDLVVDASGAIDGNVVFVEITGSETDAYIESGSLVFAARIDGIHNVRLHDAVRLAPQVDRLFVFDPSGGLLVAPTATHSHPGHPGHPERKMTCPN